MTRRSVRSCEELCGVVRAQLEGRPPPVPPPLCRCRRRHSGEQLGQLRLPAQCRMHGASRQRRARPHHSMICLVACAVSSRAPEMELGPRFACFLAWGRTLV